MSKTSDAAKAASILHHTWGIDSYAQALLVYNELATRPELDIVQFLEELNAGIWCALTDAGLSEVEWWENVEALALSIDAARDYFQSHGIKETA